MGHDRDPEQPSRPEPKLLSLDDKQVFFIQGGVEKIVRTILQKRRLSADELKALVGFLKGIERLPATSDSMANITLSDEHQDGRRWMSIEMTEEELSFEQGESLFCSYGTESSSETIFKAGLCDDYTNLEKDESFVFSDLENWLIVFLNRVEEEDIEMEICYE